MYLESTLSEIKENSIVINTKSGYKEIECDNVILSVGYVPSNTIAEAGKNIHIIGDAEKAGNLKHVIWSAYDLCIKI